MKELIKITEKDGVQAVSARELYIYLGYTPSQWKRWYNKNIINDAFFEENIDYQTFDIMSSGNKTKDFALTMDMAKHICMLARTEEGKTARDYFIDIEKKFKKPQTQAEMFLQSAQMLVEQEKKISKNEKRIELLEAKQMTSPEYYTVVAYGALNGIPIDLRAASSLGKKATKICKEIGVIPGELPDPRFGRVKTYPLDILKEAFEKIVA